ncbi:flippase [Aeromicrobium piscarium]|uniref:Flippase n=1 Tax=Aeromicrobium piscarium TaxID=2590901 RepID=A0A554RJH4_9ACTN|nr:flippase [Aeromicrobium piscarium]TSD54276.1 flippase [Aeromicrobium piscarium]
MGSARANGIWAVSQQIVTVGLAGLFSIALVRVVSVEDFGVFSYATAIATLGVSIMTGGMQALAVREFRNSHVQRSVILSSVFFIREVMAVVVYLVFVVYSVGFAGSGTWIPTAVACVAVLARVFDAPELVFQSDLRTKTPALIRTVTAVVFFGVRIAAILLWPTLAVFLILFVLEQLVAALVIFGTYRRVYPAGSLARREWSYTKRLARDAAPLSLSGLANQVGLRASVITLQTMSGPTTVAIYAAASRLSELLHVVPTAYMAATFPSLLDLKSNGNDAVYHRMLRRSLSGSFYLGIVVAVVTALLADPIVLLLFGEQYGLSSDVLRILAITCPFIFMAAVLSKWIVAEGVLWASLLRHSIGAVLAVGLNVALIPSWGAVGSAWATVGSSVAASYLFCFLTRSTWLMGAYMTLAPVEPLLAAIRKLRG